MGILDASLMAYGLREHDGLRENDDKGQYHHQNIGGRRTLMGACVPHDLLQGYSKHGIYLGCGSAEEGGSLGTQTFK